MLQAFLGLDRSFFKFPKSEEGQDISNSTR